MPSKKIEIYRSFSSEETKKLGFDIARTLTLARGDAVKKRCATVFALQGDLGAGKTTFVQGFLKGLGSKKRATSPTFVLMRRHTLETGRTGGKKKFKNVFHIDAYRLKKPEHVAALTLDVILNEPCNIVLIEWPEQAKKFLPKNMMWIKFKYGKKENERTIAIVRSAKNNMKKLFLIDANSIIHRSFHALPPFTTPEGKPSGAIYGIASILLKLWRDERPDYAAALFDRPEPTFRDEKYAEYKAQRPPAAEELVAQIIEAHKLFEAFGIKTFEKPGYEADDLIATLAEKFKTLPDVQVVILTGDRDTLQMVEGDKLVVQTFNKGVSDTTIYNEAAVIEKYGIAPKQMVDYKALVGDSSDNIKGVPGVGPKTALELIKKIWHSEENV